MKQFFNSIDLFGVPILFKYQNKNKYSTSLGGLSFTLLCLFIISVLIFNFISFLNRKNYNIIYYSTSMTGTEEINLDESETTLAIGLDCDEDNNGTKATDLLQLDLFFITYSNQNGNRTKNTEEISTHSCNYEDFYNKFNDSVDYLQLNKYHCFDKKNSIIKGIYTDEIFTYYQFTVSAKNDSVSHFQKIDDYLLRNDCKLQFYYTDNSFDLTDYANPAKPYINVFFLQLSPILFLKTNIFFMNQYFVDDRWLIFNEGNEKSNSTSLFSRIEEYSLYKGLNRGEVKPKGYKNCANIYVRADTKKTEIKRKYEKLTEFFAGFSSLFVVSFNLLNIILNYINNFYAEHSIIKRIFYFKDIEFNKFDSFKKQNQIKKLISLTEPFSDKIYKNKLIYLETSGKENSREDSNNLKNIEIKRRETDPEINNKEKKRKIIVKKKYRRNNNFWIKMKEKQEEDFKIISQTIQKYLSKEANSKSIINVNTDNLIKNAESKKEEKGELKVENDFQKVKFSFNLFEIIIISFFKCCMTKNMTYKNNLTLKARNIISNKLDIVQYIRNMILFDILIQILVEDNKKDIFNFLIRPKLSLNINEENIENKFYLDYTEADFDKFYNAILEMTQNSNSIKSEKKLIYKVNQELKKLI